MPKNKSSFSQSKKKQFSWNYIYHIALDHKKELFSAHIIAIFATIASVPVPLLMPLLVDEVLLNNPGVTVASINQFLPGEWQIPIIYIASILIFSLALRIIAIIFFMTNLLLTICL